MKINSLLYAALTLSLLLSGCGAGGGKNEPRPAGEEWPEGDPKEYGLDAGECKTLENFLIDSTHATGVLILGSGKEIFSFGALDRLSYIASCRKSVLAMMYGKYVENGTIDLSKTLEELGVDDIGGLLPIEKKATVFDLITARSGCYHPASNSGDNTNKPERGTKQPGTYFLYNNWDFNLAGALFEQFTGKDIYDAFYEDIGQYIGLQDWNREVHVKGGDLSVSRYPSYHFHFSTRDMARIGYLMLRHGNWNGRQVVSEDWCKRITTEYSSWEEVNESYNEEGRYGYGMMWWLFDDKSKENSPLLHGAYTARGAMGQYITVIPELDMVIAFKTDRIYGRTTSHKTYLKFLDQLLSFVGTDRS